MKTLFLASFFSGVASLFKDFVGEDIKGKTVTFIPTAAIPEKVTFYVGADKKALEKLGLIVDELEITKSTQEEIKNKLETNDFIFVSGGNTFYLLQELIKTGTDKIIKEQIKKGKIYIGASAGSMILSPNIEYAGELDDSGKAPELKNKFKALNEIDFYPIPHFGNIPFKKAGEKIVEKYSSTLKLISISNSQVITVKGKEIKIETKEKKKNATLCK
ncbi:putative peptidase Lmo0363 [Fibrobacterales bacterium]|nr:putative peptidase Lmo0363 [Fibrobacterales bacterium]